MRMFNLKKFDTREEAQQEIEELRTWLAPKRTRAGSRNNNLKNWLTRDLSIIEQPAADRLYPNLAANHPIQCSRPAYYYVIEDLGYGDKRYLAEDDSGICVKGTPGIKRNIAPAVTADCS